MEGGIQQDTVVCCGVGCGTALIRAICSSAAADSSAWECLGRKETSAAFAKPPCIFEKGSLVVADLSMLDDC